MRDSGFVIIMLFFFFTASAVNAQQFNGGLMAGVAGTQVAGDTYSGLLLYLAPRVERSCQSQRVIP